ncbi:MAG: NAD(P)H-dependent oxidoreductase subunit E [Candidatus Aureabacteria bacterium]|nr:NAD(P)H-dependent oxidoreductase subunit E [Candidatus Auribacterota bacterium]
MTITVKKTEITPEMKKKLGQLAAFIKSQTPLHDNQSLLMSVLHYIQILFGFLPREAMELVSEQLHIPTAHIHGMATFYNYFTLKPRAPYQIFMCKGTACYVAGGARVLDKLKEVLKTDIGENSPDGLFSLNITRCLGCCGLSPVMQINEDIHVRIVPEKIPEIIEHYKQKHKKKNIESTQTEIGGFEHPAQ